jgi:hypothetical protein
MNMRISILTFFILLFSLNTYGQLQKLENYKKFDQKLLHFGVQLGFNKTSLNLTPTLDAYSKYGLKSIQSSGQPGAQVGMVASFRLGSPVLRLRIVPTFSFQERIINYTYPSNSPDSKTEILNQEHVNSSNLDFPFMLQLRTLRHGNFAAYATTGIQYTVDLQSVQDKTQNLIDPFIKIKKYDYMMQFGGGVEFFAEFFKCGIEIKYSQGFKNVLIQDNTLISSPIYRLQNNSWIVSITFEG